MDGPLAGRIKSHLKNLAEVVTPSAVFYEVYQRLKRDASEGVADAIVYATAQRYRATLVTSDADFKNIPNVIYLKKGRAN